VKKQNLYYIAACIILILSVLYVRGYNKETKIPPLQPITGFPSEFKGFHGKDVRPSYKNFHDPSADEKALRIYTKNGDDKLIRVFIGYWENQNEKKKISPPRYTGNRWGYYWIKTRTVSIASNKVKLKQFLIERGHEKELVYYCYIVNGKIVSSEYHLRLLNLLNSFLYGRNNAAVLRISMPVTDDWPIEKAEVYEEIFIKEILPLLLEYV